MTLPVEVTVIMKEECALLVRSPEFRRSPVMTQLLEFLVDFCIAQDSRGPRHTPWQWRGWVAIPVLIRILTAIPACRLGDCEK